VDNNGLARGRGASRLKHWYPSDRSPVLPKAVTGSGGWWGSCAWCWRTVASLWRWSGATMKRRSVPSERDRWCADPG